MLKPCSKVYLVGAGPGDPELLTVKAVRLIENADVVVYDRLVSDAVLNLIPKGTARIYVGKVSGNHSLPQGEINELLVRLSARNRAVVRLKGGDPFVFGRGSEEAETLAANGVPFEVIPGITAASGISAALGAPLTHRGLAHSVRLVTGHIKNDGQLDLNWASLADPDTTLVFYMGLANLAEISRRLIEAGLPADTPAAAISNGTVAGQRQCIAPLSQLPDVVSASDLKAPVLTVVGRVVDMVAKLNWQGLPIENEGTNGHVEALLHA